MLNFLDGVAASNVDGVALDDAIKDKQILHCGVLVPDGFVGDITSSDQLVGMSVDYCRGLAAALFRGIPIL